MTTQTDAPETGNIQQDLDAIKHDLMNLRSSLSDIFSDFMNYGKNQASDAREKIEQTLHERLRVLNDKAQHLRQHGWEAMDKVGRQIEVRPWTAVGVAVGVGVLLGALLARK